MPKTIRDISDTVYRRFFQKKIEDGYEDRSWNDYLSYLARNTSATLTQNEAFKEMEQKLLTVWMKNFADNLPYIRFGHHLEKKPLDNNLSALEQAEPAEPRPGIVVGRGPSLFMNQHIELLSKSNFSGKVFATDGALINLLEEEIVPDLTLTVDGSPIIKKWYDHPAVIQNAPKLKVALTSTVNHDVYRFLIDIGCQVYWYYPVFDDYRDIQSFTNMQMLMTTSEYNKEKLYLLRCGGNAGTATWMAALKLFKCSPIALIGIDFGYPEGTKMEDTPYYSTVIATLEGDAGKLNAFYSPSYHPVFKTKATTDHVFKRYCNKFLELQLLNPRWYMKLGGTINCTEGGTLYGPRIACMTFAEFLKKYKGK